MLGLTNNLWMIQSGLWYHFGIPAHEDLTLFIYVHEMLQESADLWCIMNKTCIKREFRRSLQTRRIWLLVISPSYSYCIPAFWEKIHEVRLFIITSSCKTMPILGVHGYIPFSHTHRLSTKPSNFSRWVIFSTWIDPSDGEAKPWPLSALWCGKHHMSVRFIRNVCKVQMEVP